MADIEDLRTKTDDQLSTELTELKREQYNLRFQAATNQLEKPSRIREVRQGKGKGSVEYWAARVKPGRILFELDGVAGPLAAEAFERAAMKLPIKTKVVARLGDTAHLGGE